MRKEENLQNLLTLPDELPEGVSIIIKRVSPGNSSDLYMVATPTKSKKFNFKLLLGFINSFKEKLAGAIPKEEIAWISIAVLVVTGTYVFFKSDIDISVPDTGISKAIKSVATKNQTLQFPLKGYSRSDARLTSTIGENRPLGCRVNCRKHAGNDYAAKNMVAIALADGYIARQSEVDSLGLMANSPINNPPSVGHIVSIIFEKANQKYLARYVHLDRPFKDFREGDKIKKGDEIASITTAWAGSSGAHLHLEIYRNENEKWILADSEDLFKIK